MNTPSHSIPALQRLYWASRREIWESRSIYIAPLAVAAVFLFGYFISLIGLVARVRAAVDPVQQQQLVEQPFRFAELLIMGTTAIVAVFYCLDALYGERRDRSILFWKSLPVSDLTTVVSKATIPLVVLPLVTFAITVVLEAIMLIVSAAVLEARGVGAAALWNQLWPLQAWTMLLYHLVTIHALWYAPIYGWLLLASAWARRVPFLWAALPPLAIGVLERIAFNTSHVAAMLAQRVGGGPDSDLMGTPHAVSHLDPGQFLLAPGLWIGLGLTAVFLAAAVRLRRSQSPI